jgi:hypothetical protein
MSYQHETFEDRVVRLLGTQLRNPEKTKTLLARLSSEQREQPQPRNCDAPRGGHATQMHLFERGPLECEAAALARPPSRE